MASLGSIIDRVLSGIIFIDRNGLRWHDTRQEYGPYNAPQQMEAVEQQRHKRPDDGWTGGL